MAQDAQLVIIDGEGKGPDQFGQRGDVWRYCVRSEGRYRLLVVTTPCCGAGGGDPRLLTNVVQDLTLAGKYIGYISAAYGRGDGFSSRVSVLLDARTRVETYSDVFNFDYVCAGVSMPAPMLVLSPAGVELFLVTATPYPAGCLPGKYLSPFAVLQAVTTHALTLDTGNPGEIGNPGLYQCSAGCPRGQVVAAWTHDTAWRYQLVQ